MVYERVCYVIGGCHMVSVDIGCVDIGCVDMV